MTTRDGLIERCKRAIAEQHRTGGACAVDWPDLDALIALAKRAEGMREALEPFARVWARAQSVDTQRPLAVAQRMISDVWLENARAALSDPSDQTDADLSDATSEGGAER